jgi:hypothetical protein
VVVGDLIGEGSAQEQSVVGETPNLASRRQALAQPETVAPLIGRDEEIELLRRRWERAKPGRGQVLPVSGEPGIGKSHIVAALAERLHAAPHFRRRYFCSPYHQDSALFPFIDRLGRASGFAADDAPSAKREKHRASGVGQKFLDLQNTLVMPAKAGIHGSNGSRLPLGRRSITCDEFLNHCARPSLQKPLGGDQARSKRSRFITLVHAATKSFTNFSFESAQA